ncbi:hypothetical protein DSL72_005555 [Monilinia vaccinii-corymbosi]|uniref:Nucleotide exchange factor SIL1 n=1 Tax=Monilinia vaccinii-corymbosi TaxID=61207 RepID=A0A8A3PFZ7_9HELO|nr:hypothetical protein DSL72_005555 [Monilinia vaccinii-corymbosi]
MTTNNNNHPAEQSISLDDLNLASEEEDSDSEESLASLESDFEEETPPEKILTEIVGKNSRIWYLVKWKDCPLLRSSWEGEACFESYPWILEQWSVDKQSQKEGKSQPFDVQGFDQASWLSLPIFARAFSMDPAASPSADTELICPTNNQAECYPRLFHPTKDFQVIKPGQDIPPGLHVRLNISSGLKEARLNIPMEGEDTPLELDIPTEQAMVVIEDAEVKPSEEPQPQPSSSPPAYSSHGKIQPPPPSSSDFESFRTSLASLKGHDASVSLDLALTSLSELSHDIYYGSEIMADKEAVSALICLVAMEPLQSEDGHDHLASAILSGSLQNNPTAITSLSLFHDIVMTPTCSRLRREGLRFIPALQKKLSAATTSPSSLKSQISALSGLLKSPEIQKSFLQQGGTSYLQSVFLKQGPEYDIVRKRVVQLLMDNFLDENMGARMGVWPKTGLVQKGEKECDGDVINDDCWAWHGKEFYGTGGGRGEWMKEFLERLRKGSQGGERNKEL